MKKLLGHIIAGSLTEGFVMRIENSECIEDIKTGKFVSIAGKKGVFFSLITDVKLEVSNPDILLLPPKPDEQLLASIVSDYGIYATATVRPMLMMDTEEQPTPVKSIPSHFCPVYEATAKDVANIFGDEKHESKRYFNVGHPLDMSTPVCIDLERLVERSNGIFGKTGTGKTFLTRLVLAGLIKQEKAVNIIFDMHSEYGLQARQEGGNKAFVKGLKTLFADKIAIFSLDPASTRRRGSMPDVEVLVPYQSIHVEDIISLEDELNLHATALEAAYLITARHKEDWLAALLKNGDNIKEFADQIGAHPESIAALYRKLKRIEHLPFCVNTADNQDDVISNMLGCIDKGISVIIEFGNYTSTFCYLLIANIITRRIHAEYIKKTERFLGSQHAADEPKKLMITIEEAHKFLNPSAARQTIFGTIAREMRKYYVSLLIVDQRPSGIDPEILSQIGTKIIAQLNDERDIQAVLLGTNNSHNLRSILASLDTKKQALLLGHAVAMPVVVQTREYDDAFYRDMGQITAAHIDTFIKELF
jgi:DNA helicase HerA-like ATPase